MATWRWRNFPVPEAHVGALVVGGLLHAFWPWRIGGSRPAVVVVGWSLVVVGVAVAWWGTVAAGRENLDRPGHLVTGGPYRFSRNPMYVGWTVLAVGIALVVGSWWLIVAAALAFVLVHLLDVLGEERTLEERFGEEYRSYRARVRRYL